MSRKEAVVSPAPIAVHEFQDLFDELHTNYLHVNATLQFSRIRGSHVEMAWHVEADTPLSLLVLPAVTQIRSVTGNKPYNVMQTLYDTLYSLIDIVEAHISSETKIVVFPV